jgi:hypothetical protein
VVFWPDPDDLLITDQKVHMYRNIIAASAAHGYLTPEILVVKRSDVCRVATLIEEGKLNAVLKRSFSFGEDHVFWPGKKGFSETWKLEKFWENQDFFGHPQWLLQPFLPLMQTLGELRAFVSNGQVYDIFVTNPGADEEILYTPLTEFRPLSRFG